MIDPSVETRLGLLSACILSEYAQSHLQSYILLSAYPTAISREFHNFDFALGRCPSWCIIGQKLTELAYTGSHDGWNDVVSSQDW